VFFLAWFRLGRGDGVGSKWEKRGEEIGDGREWFVFW
jgi:hypothetical protein